MIVSLFNSSLIETTIQEYGSVILPVGIVAIGAAGALKKLYDSNTVKKVMEDRTITHPQIPKVEEIQEGKQKPIYVCSVYNSKTEEWEQANIFYNVEDEEHNFEMNTVSGTALGRIKILTFHMMEDGEFGCPALIIQLDSISKYGHEKDLIPKIEVKDLENKAKDTYKYVGYNLMKVAMQKFQDYECKVDLSAAWSSHTFYWKLGFRPNNPDECKRIAKQVLEGRTTKDLGIVKMHLPQWASDSWLQEIQDNPMQEVSDEKAITSI